MWREIKLGEKVRGIPTKALNRAEWLELRNGLDGIGGSEIGIVMGKSNFVSPTRLFYQKVGLWDRNIDDNMNMFMGRLLEDQIVNMWRAWDGGEESMMNNMDSGLKVNRSQKCNYIIQNPDFPWLFANIDNRILSIGGVKRQGILECKTISSYNADSCYKRNRRKYPDDQNHIRFPDYYILQVMGYMTVCGYDLGEIAILEAGNRFSVNRVEASDDLQTAIVETTRDFMERVVEAKKALKGVKNKDQQRQVADQFAPDPDGSKDFSDLTYEQEKLEETMEITNELHNLAVDHDSLLVLRDNAVEEYELNRNKIRAAMGPYVNAVGDGLTITNRKRLNVNWK